MSDMKVVYEDVQVVATKLRQVATDTVPKLTLIQNAVNGLLADGGGLWLMQSSPVLNEKYQAFNTSVTQAVNSIPSWANQFENIVAQLRDMDAQIVEAAKATG
ncbi:hypothetical protein LWF15_09210 [Kineosporia rhizophila]|nr:MULTISPECIES: hypothetical protein [Kineosporia]MCE0535690.1 hypothetical protein [Kineosporia rhizophila]GLY17664.1 hypothetical protein Kisp01_46780 [Kineosporia sp. NBRC 101677]